MNERLVKVIGVAEVTITPSDVEPDHKTVANLAAIAFTSAS